MEQNSGLVKVQLSPQDRAMFSRQEWVACDGDPLPWQVTAKRMARERAANFHARHVLTDTPILKADQMMR